MITLSKEEFKAIVQATNDQDIWEADLEIYAVFPEEMKETAEAFGVIEDAWKGAYLLVHLRHSLFDALQRSMIEEGENDGRVEICEGSYVAIYDSEGNEVVRWVADEFEEDVFAVTAAVNAVAITLTEGAHAVRSRIGREQEVAGEAQ